MSGEAVYIYAGNLAEAERCAEHQGYAPMEWVYVGKPVSQFIKEGPKRTMYCIGSYNDRFDKDEVRRLAHEHGWTVLPGFAPPRKDHAK